MEIDLPQFHEFLRGELPAPERDITARLDVCHRALPRAYAAFPNGAAAVSEAMRELERQGKAVRDGSDWKWASGEVKRVEKMLFA